MPAYKIQFARSDDTNTWHDAAFSTTRQITVCPGQPERILVRAILLQNNQPVGAPAIRRL